MPTNDEADDVGQACQCLGCRIREAIVPDETQPMTAEQAQEALDALTRNAIAIILDHSTNPLGSGRHFVEQFGQKIFRSLKEQQSTEPSRTRH